MSHPWVFLLLLILFSGGQLGLPILITLLAVACS
jgi:hypothetical protein